MTLTYLTALSRLETSMPPPQQSNELLALLEYPEALVKMLLHVATKAGSKALRQEERHNVRANIDNCISKLALAAAEITLDAEDGNVANVQELLNATEDAGRSIVLNQSRPNNLHERN